jgi:hypothetical protein
LKQLFIFVLLTATLLRADTKAETELRTQLAQTQAALAAASKDRIAMQVELTAAVAKLGVANRVQAAADAQQRTNLSNKAEASAVRADANAVQAQQTADSARVTAEAANTQAVISAVAAKVQADALIRVSDQSHTASLATLITSCFGFLTLIAGFGWKAFTDSRDHRWLMETTAQAATVTALHRQTELQKISEVQSSAQAAYSEANTVNKKIESIGLKMADSKPLNPTDEEIPPLKK